MKQGRQTIFAGVSALVLFALTAGNALAFGAIAVNDHQGVSARDAGYGVGWGSTRREAERNAMRECLSAGNDQCQVAVWFERCGAYAGDRVNYGIGYGVSRRVAEQQALDNCPHCRIIVSECQ